MASLNKVQLIGHLGADPETRFMPNGDAVANVRLATTESWKDKATGEKKEITEWHRVVFFRKLAEIVGQYLKKGSAVYIEGRIRTRKWQDKEGQERYTTEIEANEMQMLGGKTQEQASSTQGPRPHASSTTSSFSDMQDDIPFILNMNDVCDTAGKPKSLWRAKYGKGMLLMLANKTVC